MNFFVIVIQQFFLLAVTTQSYHIQTLDFEALDPKQTDLVFQVGWTIRLECRYQPDYCDSLETTDLIVYPPTGLPLDSLVVVNRSKCHLVLELHNLTQQFNGIYICNDTILGSWHQRLMYVGYPPEMPENLTLIYQPLKFISLILNSEQMKELVFSDTSWNVTYRWRYNHLLPCSDVPNKRLYFPNNMSALCTLDLHNKYSGGHSYGNNLGSIFSTICFNVMVKNIFGTVAVEHCFLPIAFIMPDTVKKVKVIQRGTTWLLLQVAFPTGIDNNICSDLSKSLKTASELKISYTVTFLSELQQIQWLEPSRQYYQRFGMWRNLHSDKETLNHFSSVRHFPVSQVFNWTDFNCGNANLNLSGLPPNSHVNITLQAASRYWGPKLSLNIKDTFTSEDISRAGPMFGISPYLCFLEDMCMSCVIYFLEIPHPLRGGQIIKYTLNGTCLSGSERKEIMSCQNRYKFSTFVGGEENTFLIQELEPLGIYNLSLQAHVSKGVSPVTTYHLHPVFLSDGPVHTIVERKKDTYTVSWSINNLTKDKEVWQNSTHYMHYCFAQSFDLLSEENNNLNCRTNLVTLKADNRSQTKSVIISDYNVRDLVPIFFVSMTTQDGKSSGLFKVKCFYSSEKLPGRPESLTVYQSDPDGLVVTFRIPCGQNYGHHRIPGFHIIVKPSNDCPPIAFLQNRGDTLLEVDVHVGDQYIQQKLINLQPNTAYCVGVRERCNCTTVKKWIWKSVFTKDGKNYVYFWALVILPLGLLAVLLILRFHLKKKISETSVRTSEDQVQQIRCSPTLDRTLTTPL